ncbi:hypothetical protein BANRA_05853 [Klebsiella pneumoniae]|nr:hypothetical protein BANRA_05853 [Klebsiella pneumoniae]
MNASRNMTQCGLSAAAERAAEKLRSERQYCRHIAVFVKTSPFAVKEPYYGNMASESLPFRAETRGISSPLPSEPLGRIWVPSTVMPKPA